MTIIGNIQHVSRIKVTLFPAGEAFVFKAFRSLKDAGRGAANEEYVVRNEVFWAIENVLFSPDLRSFYNCKAQGEVVHKRFDYPLKNPLEVRSKILEKIYVSKIFPNKEEKRFLSFLIKNYLPKKVGSFNEEGPVFDGSGSEAEKKWAELRELLEPR